MLTILQETPGCYVARSGKEILGRCRFEIREEETVVCSLEVKEPEDLMLVDGLVRTVLFFGLDNGAPVGVLPEPVWASYEQTLKRLGFQMGRMETIKLPRRCHQ